MQATSTAIRQQRWSAGRAETEAAAEVGARLTAIERGGRHLVHVDLDKTAVMRDGEKFAVSVQADNNSQDGSGELALVFTSYTRTTGRQVRQMIEGRETYAGVSHGRRALVTAAGHVWVEVDGRLALSANKYERAAREILARLTALGLWRADRLAYTSAKTFADAA